MRFAYYETLSADSKRTYARATPSSGSMFRFSLPSPARPGDRARARRGGPQGRRACLPALVDAINARLETPPVRMNVLERRPSNSGGELHGLYEPDEVTGGVAKISVWMRTAQKEQVVKFRTFLRTVVHELCHHFDYELYGLAETFHTQGFYTREST
jgi:hypothetical protein